MAREIKGILFDKDGTLFDFQTSWVPIYRSLLDELADGPAHAAALSRVIGLDPVTGQFHPEAPAVAASTTEIVGMLLPHLPGWSGPALEEFVNRWAEAVPLSPVTDIAGLVRLLRDAGLATGVATNDTEAAAHAHLAGAGASAAFDFVAGYDSGHGAKPDPGMILAFCARMGLQPASVAMVGDSTHDLTAARAAGAMAIAVLTGVAGRAALAPHADLVLDSVRDLPGWLGLAG